MELDITITPHLPFDYINHLKSPMEIHEEAENATGSLHGQAIGIVFAVFAQMAEHMVLTHVVVGSTPTDSIVR
ncbi:hypothetical protein C5167_008126 [Papaver somniferum]|uniref:Uncharacterized protein n=1 Tax=Papaver somniferum TaxID=3469 RepID=A0A4Y7JWS7_PAPSO|nr:hypothetical protein C5167_008126 [Papaver somniferum]